MKIIKFFLLIYILFIQSIALADNNFNEWEKKYCWLCGLPLSFGTNPRNQYPGQAISCEHKLPVLEMILFGAGLQTAIDENKMARIDSTTSSPVKSTKPTTKNVLDFSRLHADKIDPVWKETVRSEAYGWSHNWCNMKKNGCPFITVRNWKSGGKGEETLKIQFNMEINNIYQFVCDLFNITEIPRLLSTFRDFPTGGAPYSFRKVEKEGSWDPIEYWCDDIHKIKGEEKQKFKFGQAERAFSNIVKMLVPTFYLLNSGKEAPKTLKEQRDQLFGAAPGKEKRSMFNGIDETSIFDRFKDNFLRLKSVGVLPHRERLQELFKANDFPEIILNLFDCNVLGLKAEAKDTAIEKFYKNMDLLFKLEKPGDESKDSLTKFITRNNTYMKEQTERVRINDHDILDTIEEELYGPLSQELSQELSPPATFEPMDDTQQMDDTQPMDSIDYESYVDETVDTDLAAGILAAKRHVEQQLKLKGGIKKRKKKKKRRTKKKRKKRKRTKRRIRKKKTKKRRKRRKITKRKGRKKR